MVIPTFMASVHKLPGKPNWVCFFTDRTNKRRCKSTLTVDKREAERVCFKLQEIEDRARSGRLTEDRARKVIETAVAEIMEACGSPIEQKTVREHFESWLKGATLSIGTFKRYECVAQSFLTFLGGKADQHLATLRSKEIEDYRNELADRVASGTVNAHLKVIRVCLEKAIKQRYFDSNPGRLVENVATSDKHRRRAFTMDELKKLIAIASPNWKTMILIGLYTGLRLRDCVNLTALNLDLSNGEFTLTEAKTSKTRIVPIAKPLLSYLEGLDLGDDPRAPLCPGLAGKVQSSLSNEFFDLMAAAGLVVARSHQKSKNGKGRSSRRKQSEITFHALRHTATSLLKRAGVSNAVAMDLIGHASEAVSRNYTHIDDETKRNALNRLPDVTK